MIGEDMREGQEEQTKHRRNTNQRKWAQFAALRLSIARRSIENADYACLQSGA